jgi:WD40 repeat protein
LRVHLPATSVSLREEGLRATIQQPLVNAVAFSPDGSRLVTGDFNGSVRLWDPRTGRELGSISGNLGDVIDFAFVLDGTRIATS